MLPITSDAINPITSFDDYVAVSLNPDGAQSQDSDVQEMDDASQWNVTGTICDANGNSCNITINATSVEASCSNEAQGRHDWPSSVFHVKKFTRFFIGVAPVLDNNLEVNNGACDGLDICAPSVKNEDYTYTPNDLTSTKKAQCSTGNEPAGNTSQNIHESMKSNQTEERVTTTPAAAAPTFSMMVGFARQASPVTLINNSGLQKPLRLQWNRENEMKFHYNCWNGT